jgi:hypothetical protein
VLQLLHEPSRQIDSYIPSEFDPCHWRRVESSSSGRFRKGSRAKHSRCSVNAVDAMLIRDKVPPSSGRANWRSRIRPGRSVAPGGDQRQRGIDLVPDNSPTSHRGTCAMRHALRRPPNEVGRRPRSITTIDGGFRIAVPCVSQPGLCRRRHFRASFQRLAHRVRAQWDLGSQAQDTCTLWRLARKGNGRSTVWDWYFGGLCTA